MYIVRLALKRRLVFAFGMYRLACHDHEATLEAAFLATSCRQAGFKTKTVAVAYIVKLKT